MKRSSGKILRGLMSLVILALLAPTSASADTTHIIGQGLGTDFFNVQSSQPNPVYIAGGNHLEFGEPLHDNENYMLNINSDSSVLGATDRAFRIDIGDFATPFGVSVSSPGIVPGTGIDSVNVASRINFMVNTETSSGSFEDQFLIDFDFVRTFFKETTPGVFVIDDTRTIPVSVNTLFHGVEYTVTMKGWMGNGSIELAKVPEPATMLLYGFGFLGAAGYKRIRKRFKAGGIEITCSQAAFITLILYPLIFWSAE